MEKCKFYELDTYLKETEDQLLEAYGPAPDIPEQDRPARPEILDQCCGQLCKWMVIGEGFPVEGCYGFERLPASEAKSAQLRLLEAF